MAQKTASVITRLEPDVKQQAEEILKKLGIPVSVLIDSLYRQIIMTNGIPYSLQVPKFLTADSMTREQFDSMMEQGLKQAKSGKGIEIDEAFKRIEESL